MSGNHADLLVSEVAEVGDPSGTVEQVSVNTDPGQADHIRAEEGAHESAR